MKRRYHDTFHTILPAVRAGPEILKACGFVYINFFFYKFRGLKFFFRGPIHM